MDKKLLEILACPICKGQLMLGESKQTLVCRFDKLVYPIRDGVPIMLPEQASPLKEG